MELFGLACVVCWNVWNFRNGHGTEMGDRETMVARSSVYLDSFKSVRIHFPIPHPPIPVVQWSRPKRPFIKVNFDAAVSSSSYYQVAAVARDSSGGCLRWAVCKLRGSVAPAIAEACAARHALIMAKDMGWSHPQLEEDCLEVINTLKTTRARVFDPLDLLLPLALIFPLILSLLVFLLLDKWGTLLPTS